MNHTLQLRAHLQDIPAIIEFVTETAVSLGSTSESLSEMAVAVDEAVSNAIIHGYQRQAGLLTIEIKRLGHDLAIYLRDNAPLFDPTTVPTPDISLPLDQRLPGGLGVHMMRQFSDEVHYQVTADKRNELTLIKKNAFPDEQRSFNL